MNILFFANRIIYGGGERVRNWLANNLINSGHKVIYAIPSNSEHLYGEIENVGLKDKVIIVEYPFSIKKKAPRKYWKTINELYRKNGIDLLIYFGGSAIEQIIARSLGVKVLLSERCDPHSRSVASQILKQIQYRVADSYVFQTPAAAKCYGTRAYKLSTIIPNPILDKSPEPIFNNLRKEIVSVGRLSKEKNQILLLQAFKKIHETIPDYSLSIYGSGPLESMLNEFVVNNRLDNKVHIIKGKTNITELINGASLFVLPSNTEGMPNALIEAMSMGVLSVSTDCPIYGPRYLIKHGENAYLTPVGNVDKLAEIILYALNDKNADIIRRNDSGIRQTLDANKIFSYWLQCIESVVKEKSIFNNEYF